MKEQEVKTAQVSRSVPVALFAALIAAGALIVIPLGPVPLTAQNMIAVLAGCVLGGVRGAASVGLFLTAGALGLPIFAGGTGGVGILTGPTGGFLIGYFFAALCAGSIAGQPAPLAHPFAPRVLLRLAAAAAAGFALIYIPGIYLFINVTSSTLEEALPVCLIPFLPGDLIKLVLTIPIAARLRPLAARYLSPPDDKRDESRF